MTVGRIEGNCPRQGAQLAVPLPARTCAINLSSRNPAPASARPARLVTSVGLAEVVASHRKALRQLAQLGHIVEPLHCTFQH
jgi:hypothetical protein